MHSPFSVDTPLDINRIQYRLVLQPSSTHTLPMPYLAHSTSRPAVGRGGDRTGNCGSRLVCNGGMLSIREGTACLDCPLDCPGLGGCPGVMSAVESDGQLQEGASFWDESERLDLICKIAGSGVELL
jgi:hypothetical protein